MQAYLHPALNKVKFTMSVTQSKIIRNTKKHENMTHNQEKNQYIEIHTKMTKIFKLVGKNTQTVTTVFQLVKTEEKKVHMFKLEIWKLYEITQIVLLEMKTIMSDMKNTLDVFNGRLKQHIRKDS